MDHLAVVQGLIRAGLDGNVKNVVKQAERLASRLEKTGDDRAYKAIRRTLETTARANPMAPSKLTLSKNLITGEVLSPSTLVPMDKETGASLCQIMFAKDLIELPRPAYSERVSEVLSSFLEEWKHPERLAELGVKPTRTVLLYGPPGSGKTLAAQYIARQLQLPLVTARIDGLISSFLGTTARNIANLFEFANRFRCVLLLDEFDAIAKVRNDPNELGEIKRVVNTLLQNLDDRKGYGITFAITNHEVLLDPAVWRRFELHLDIGSPGSSARESILQAALSPVELGTDLSALLTHLFEGQSGADLERIANSAKRLLALSGSDATDMNILRAFAELGSRLPGKSTSAIHALSLGLEGLARFIVTQDNPIMSQKQISELTGVNASKITRMKKEGADA